MGGSLSFPKIDLEDKVVLITGGNTGIGYETAKWIAMLGARVIIACRSEERAKQAIARMQEEFRVAKENKTSDICSKESLAVEFMKLDCASLKSVTEFTNAFLGKENKLNILICNAGIAMHPQEYTEDGYEIMFQVNYLSQFLVALKLLPVMKKSGDDSRLILVSSAAHEFAKFDLQKAQGKHLEKKDFDRLIFYSNTKLYQIMQMYSMNELLSSTNVTVNSLHPGVVASEIRRNFYDMTSMNITFFLYRIAGRLKSPYEGACTVIKAAIDPEYKGARNNYYEDCKAKTANETSRNEMFQYQLWEYTLDCLKDYITDDDLWELNSK